MKDFLISIITVSILVLFLVAIIYNPGKESWEEVGPRWACMLNPEKYEFCTEQEIDGSNKP